MGENMNDDKNKLNYEQKEIADEVADEILTVDDDNDRHYLWLIILFLICLIFLVASLSFAIFNTYYNGGHGNVIDVGTKIKVDEDKTNTKHHIDSGVVLLSYSEKSNYIYMNNVLPTRDDVGMKLSGDKEYFDFNVSSTIINKKSGKLIYEISLIPLKNNTIDSKYIRTYLTEDNKAVSINSNDVNAFSKLPDSKYNDGKVIFKKELENSYIGDYVFRMWYSYDAPVYEQSKKFGCKVVVDAYYE